MSWLPDAAKAGATFAEGFKVEKVLFDDKGGRKQLPVSKESGRRGIPKVGLTDRYLDEQFDRL